MKKIYYRPVMKVPFTFIQKPMTNYGYVYVTTDMRNGKKYVGQHKGNFNPEYLGGGLLITRVVNKYGKSKFTIKPIVFTLSKKSLDRLERKWIKKLDTIWPNGYNLVDGGEGGDTWMRNPNKGEIRRKISQANKGKVWTQASKDKLRRYKKEHPPWNTGLTKETSEGVRKHSEALKGIPRKHPDTCQCPWCNYTEEYKRKSIQSNLGRKRSLTTKRRIGKALRRYWSGERRLN